MRMIKILEKHGFRQASGNVLDGTAGRLEFPRPTRSLSSDPAEELERALERSSGAVFATPTQVLLVTCKGEGLQLSPTRKNELISLVWEQPANLEKVAGWLRRSSCYPAFQDLAPRLLAAQEDGSEQRRRGVFRSRLPR
jgi:hypothetical protein